MRVTALAVKKASICVGSMGKKILLLRGIKVKWIFPSSVLLIESDGKNIAAV
tara:strand:- start:801 stop:956 length:156 start_codon:yes stop_codon:yes gene_type:complete